MHYFLFKLRKLYKNKRKCKYLMPRLYLAKINLNSSIFDAYTTVVYNFKQPLHQTELRPARL